jgi:hypothetical protein
VKKTTRKPFVVPQIKEEASLVGVTLVSGPGNAQNAGTRDNLASKLQGGLGRAGLAATLVSHYRRSCAPGRHRGLARGAFGDLL